MSSSLSGYNGRGNLSGGDVEIDAVLNPSEDKPETKPVEFPSFFAVSLAGFVLSVSLDVSLEDGDRMALVRQQLNWSRQILRTRGCRTQYSMKMKYPWKEFSTAKIPCTTALPGQMMLRYPTDHVSPIRIMIITAFWRRRSLWRFSVLSTARPFTVLPSLRMTRMKMTVLTTRMIPTGTRRPPTWGHIEMKQLWKCGYRLVKCIG